jgi:hypothetical protein
VVVCADVSVVPPATVVSVVGAIVVDVEVVVEVGGVVVVTREDKSGSAPKYNSQSSK